MAIKGKKRSRGGRARARTVAPKPRLVTPKRPFFQRTWVRATMVVLLVLTLGGIAFGAVAARRAAVEREAAQQEVARVGAAIDAAFTPVAQVAPTGIAVLPELEGVLVEIQQGEARPRRVERRVEGWREDLRGVAGRLGEIRTDRRDLRRAIDALGEGVDLHLAVLAEIPSLLEAERPRERQEGAMRIQIQLQSARGTVESGYMIYLNERVDVGLDEGTPGMQTQLPPGTNPFGVPGPGEVPIPEPTG